MTAYIIWAIIMFIFVCWMERNAYRIGYRRGRYDTCKKYGEMMDCTNELINALKPFMPEGMIEDE